MRHRDPRPEPKGHATATPALAPESAGQPTEPLAALRADPAVRAADPAARAWLLALLSRGERSNADQDVAAVDVPDK